MANKIFLTGFMGSGKSTVGALLAERLGWAFVDTDRKIEELARKSVSEIFREQGEAHFRELETRVLAEAAELPKRVISLGGGALLQNSVDCGSLIYLKAELETLSERLESGKTRRPLLSEGTLRELFEKRRPGYERARIQINSDGKTPQEVTDEILNALKESFT